MVGYNLVNFITQSNIKMVNNMVERRSKEYTQIRTRKQLIRIQMERLGYNEVTVSETFS
jgi:hypothetical protein